MAFYSGADLGVDDMMMVLRQKCIKSYTHINIQWYPYGLLLTTKDVKRENATRRITWKWKSGSQG